MSDIAIRADNLGKKYLIGHQAAQEVHPTLRDMISRTAKGLVRSAGDMLHGRQLVAGDEVEEFWALNDVSFEIKRGDVVGIIGRNGAGKSTLLKVLSRITEPSAGRVEIRGRVASLLEVGTGFHPELTGRENIYLNGAILGMTRGEIRRKFDEIVAFAEVEKFLDTPVKRYSSGMYVRLAFAVAAHLEPEILIVDEVLAVGDAEFQKKCLGKMKDVAGGGRTVLFVSHNLSSIQALCSRGLLFDLGTLRYGGSVQEAIASYFSSSGAASLQLSPNREKPISLISASVAAFSDIRLTLEVHARAAISCAIEVNLFDNEGSSIGIAGIGAWNPAEFVRLAPGANILQATIDCSGLATGTYKLQPALTNPNVCYYDQAEYPIDVFVNRTSAPGENRTFSFSEGHGSVRFPMRIAGN